jgi:AmiR/NasT family two-component response regulator
VTIESQQQIRRATSRHNHEVHQASGMIIAQTNADAEEALRRLVEHADSAQLRLDAVAADDIAGKITFA